MAGNDGAAQLQACVVRFSRLATDGTTPAGATNQITMKGMVSLDWKVVTEAGPDFSQLDSCGNIAVAYKEPDKIKRYDGTMVLATPDVEAAEMLTGGTLITAGGQSIGYSTPLVGSSGGPGVCMEIWSKAIIGGGTPPGATFADGTTASNTTVTSATAAFTSADVGRTITGTGIPANTTITAVGSSTSVTISAAATATGTGISITIGRPGGFWRNLFPKFQGILNDDTLKNDIKTMTIVGPMQQNPNIGNGPANDFPSGIDAQRIYSYWRDSAVPATSIGYQATPAQT